MGARATSAPPVLRVAVAKGLSLVVRAPATRATKIQAQLPVLVGI